MMEMNKEEYSRLTENVEKALDLADRVAESTTERYTHETMFSKLREELDG